MSDRSKKKTVIRYHAELAEECEARRKFAEALEKAAEEEGFVLDDTDEDDGIWVLRPRNERRERN